MEKILNLSFSSSLTELCELNSSFDKGILKIAYTGDNRNKTSISRETFEKCIKTIYNCPIVCNYDRETDEIGGHDMEIATNKDGELCLINKTTPIGCIPESAKIWFQDVEEDDGTVHEYLFSEALLWKRQEAYEKIKRDGVSSQSMEITVKDAEMVGNILHIKDFEFTAFTIIGVEPCFESASLEVFSKIDFKQQLSQMMQDLKECFNLINTSKEDDDIHPQDNSAEGGNKTLDKKIELAAQYNIKIEDLDFSIDDLSYEELEAKFKAMAEKDSNSFALNSNFLDEVYRSLDEITTETCWGTTCRYILADYDMETKEIYCWDITDWLLYGFTFTFEGDKVVMDFESKKRKKYSITDFEGGEQPSPFEEIFTHMESIINENSNWESKFNSVSSELSTAQSEIAELREFKSNIENDLKNREREEVLSKFSDLVGNEMFEELKENCQDYSVEDLEEKCYALRGRLSTQSQLAYSSKNKSPKLPVGTYGDDPDEPYGGLFKKFGISHRK